MPKREIGSTGLKNKMLEYCRSRGGWWFANPVSIFGHSGLPDIMGCYGGFFVGIEAKHPDGKSEARTDQLLILDAIRRAGGYGLVADRMYDVTLLLDSIDARTKAL